VDAAPALAPTPLVFFSFNHRATDLARTHCMHVSTPLWRTCAFTCCLRL
jgi:hypothetical protein